MRIYNRRGYLYAEVYIEGKRKRFSLKLADTPANQLLAKQQAALKLKELEKGRAGLELEAVAYKYLDKYAGYKITTQRALRGRLGVICNILGAQEPLIHKLSKEHIAHFYHTLIARQWSKNYITQLVFYCKTF